MFLLRTYIRNILKEIYDLDSDDMEKFQMFDSTFGDDSPIYRRTVGLQTQEEQLDDRSFLRAYQAKLQSSPAGKKMIEAFQRGDVTILHSISYEGFTASYSLGQSDSIYEASEWIKKYGKRGKDVLSTVAFPVSPSQPILGMQEDNAYSVSESFGIILKGYPVYVSGVDVMSQTLGAISGRIKKHQSQSGIAKRPNPANAEPIEDLTELKKRGAAEEVLLDNWTVIGTYKSYPPLQGRGLLKETKSYIQDSLAIGLPCNLYYGGKLTRIKNQADYEAWIETEKKGKYYV